MHIVYKVSSASLGNILSIIKTTANSLASLEKNQNKSYRELALRMSEQSLLSAASLPGPNELCIFLYALFTVYVI